MDFKDIGCEGKDWIQLPSLWSSGCLLWTR